MSLPRIVIAGTGFGATRKSLEALLSEYQIDVIEPALLLEQGADAEVLIPTMTRIDGKMMDQIRFIKVCERLWR